MSRRLAALTLGLVLVLSTSAAPAADEPKLPDTKAFDKLVIDSLRAVHNKGVELYNTLKDYLGAYRLYQGALETVRPLLAHRPEAQKLIDTGLATAEKEIDAARRAFILHETIEAVRKNLKVAIGEAKPDTPPAKKEDPKPGEPPKDGKKPMDPVKPSGLPLAPPPRELKPQ
jgi:hypothetical protein